MDSQTALNHLVKDHVLTETSEGSLRLTDAFKTAVPEQLRAIEFAQDDELLTVLKRNETESIATTLSNIAEENPLLVARLLALDEFLDAASLEELPGTAIVLDQFTDGGPRTAGAPANFLPVRGDDLASILKLFRYAIVYIWCEDCKPCDAVKSEYEAIVDQLPSEVACLTVYGPDAARTLYEEFGVDGAPVSLFTVRDSVNVRQVGAHYRQVILDEVETMLATNAPE